MKKGEVKKSRIVLLIIAIIVLLFIIINLAWYIRRNAVYGKFTDENMEETVFSTFIVPNYLDVDSDGIEFYIKYPDYLSLTGNLTVGRPEEGEDMNPNNLIIWPKFGGGYTYGYLVIENDEMYQIYIDSEGNAIYPDEEVNAVLERHKDDIRLFFDKAEERWGIAG